MNKAVSTGAASLIDAPVFILIFKTNIKYKKDISIIGPILEQHPGIIDWNIDRSDVEKILRIESSINEPSFFINIINQAGYSCEELVG